MIQLSVLGALRLSAGDDREVQRLLHQPMRVALLAYLATASPRGFHRRDRLLALFWPEADVKRARAALNQAIYVLRSVLGEDAIVTRGDEDVAIARDAITCDAVQFEQALRSGALREAVAAYTGDFLDGFFVSNAPEFERWTERERDRLRHAAADACCSLAEQHASIGDARGATQAARRAMDLVRDDERVLRRMMLVFHRLGDRAAALRAYEAFAWELTRDLEAHPSAETTKLAADIRRETNGDDGTAELPRRARARTVWLWGSGAVVAATALTAFGVTSFRQAPRVPPVVRYTLDVEHSAPVVAGTAGPPLALSPDGSTLAYLGAGEQGQQLFRRSLQQLESTPLAYTERARFPSFSPDGKWIAFESEGALRKIPATGGPAITMYSSGKNINGVSWGDDDRIVFASEGALWEISATRRVQARLIVVGDTARGELLRWPDLLPGGRAVLLTITGANGPRLGVARLPNGPVKNLEIEGSNARFVEPGHVVFARQDGALLTMPFDLGSLEPTGAVQPITDGILVGVAGAAKAAISRSGVIAYLRPDMERALAIARREGPVQRLKAPIREFTGARISRDGMQLATPIRADGEVGTRLWIYDVESSQLRQHELQQPVVAAIWTPDGKRLAYATNDSARGPGFAIRIVDAIGARGSPATLLEAQPGQLPQDFTPDGRSLVIERRDPVSQRDLWIVDVARPADARPLVVDPGDQRGARVSPDGQAISYVSDASGRDEVYVRPLSERGSATQVSSGGGREPRWGRTPRELLYRSSAGVVSAELRRADPIAVSRRHLVLTGPQITDSTVSYDVDASGHRFAIVQRTSSETRMVVLLNWFEQLRR